MDIKYLGHSSYLIKSKDGVIVTDPFDPSVGLKWTKPDAQVMTISHDHTDHNYRDGVKGDPFVIDWPGEYEKNKIRITGYRTFHDKTSGTERGGNIMYKIETEGLSILHCGDLGHLLDDALLEEIGNVDVLMIPVGGHHTIGPVEAAKIIKEIEPSIVLPMHYFQEGMNQEVFGKLVKLSEFLKEAGAEDVQPVEKLTIKKDELITDDTKVVVLS